MKRRAWWAGLLAILAAVTLEAPAFAQSNGWQEIQNGWGEVQTVPGYSVMPAPSGCVSTSVPFFGADLKLTCDGGLTYDGTNKKLVVNRIGYNAYTTAQRDALTATAGDGIYNSTTGRYEVYDGAAWHGRVRLTGDTMTGDLIVTKGAGTATGKTSVVLYSWAGATATTGTSEETLGTYTLPANTLSANYKVLRITAWGTGAANTNSKTVKVVLGATAVATTTWTATGAGVNQDVLVVRSGSNAQISRGMSGINTQSGGAGVQTGFVTASTSTETDTSTIAITVKATTATAAGDYTLRGFIVEALN